MRIIDFILGAVCFRTLYEFLSNFKCHPKSRYCYYSQFRTEEILRTKKLSFPKAKC